MKKHVIQNALQTFLVNRKNGKKLFFFPSKMNRTLERIVGRINVEFYYLFNIHSSTAVTKFLDSYYSFFRMCFLALSIRMLNIQLLNRQLIRLQKFFQSVIRLSLIFIFFDSQLHKVVFVYGMCQVLVGERKKQLKLSFGLVNRNGLISDIYVVYF